MEPKEDVKLLIFFSLQYTLDDQGHSIVCSTLLDGNIFAPSGQTDEPIDFNYKELPQSQGRLDGSIIPPRVRTDAWVGQAAAHSK